MFTAENAKVLGYLNALPSLQAFEDVCLDLSEVAHAAFDWAGEKKSTKPVVKALAQALQATGDVANVSVSRFAQGVEMLSYAAACAPLLDADRLARLIELAPKSFMAYQPIEDVALLSQQLTELLGDAAPQRRLQVLASLWEEMHNVTMWRSGASSTMDAALRRAARETNFGFSRRLWTVMESPEVRVQLNLISDADFTIPQRREVLLSMNVEDLGAAAARVLASNLHLLSFVEGLRIYRQLDSHSQPAFIADLPSSEWARYIIQKETNSWVVSSALALMAHADTEWRKTFMLEYVVTASTPDEATTAVTVIESTQKFQPYRFGNFDPSTVERVLRLAKPSATHRFLRVARADDKDLPSTFWVWAVQQGYADLAYPGSHVANMVTRGHFSDQDLAHYLGSSEPDVQKVLASRSNVRPADRSFSWIAWSVARVATSARLEGATLPAGAKTWAAYRKLEGFKVFPYPEKVKNLDGAVLPGTGSTLRLISNTVELEANAEHMGNCTAGYQSEAEGGSWAVFHFTVNEIEHNASIEIDNAFTEDGVIGPLFLEVGEVNTRFNSGDVTIEVEMAFKALVKSLNG